MDHLVEAQQLDRKTIQALFRRANQLEKKLEQSMRGKILASLFYEPSTRTRFSVESAMIRLGGNVLTTENAREFSSAAKGETLEDSVRVINHYADVIVIRHTDEGASKRAAAVSNVPIINAGDGPGQHPTQALLDLYTIEKERGKIDGLTVALVGDLKNGRTIRSLAYLLGKFKNITIYFVAPSSLRVGSDIKAYLDRHEVEYSEQDSWDELLPEIDVLYQTRIQKERFKKLSDYSKVKGSFVLTLREVERMKKDAFVMHPLPRVDEIAVEVDRSPKAAYFKQAEYGVLVRMALLEKLLLR